MINRLGNFTVLFRPGVVTGIHSLRETAARDICERFGGFDCKLFDSYLAYSGMADEGLLARVEQVNAFGCRAVSFFYPGGCCENAVRKLIISRLIGEIKEAPGLIGNRCAVVCDSRGELKIVQPRGRRRKGESSAGALSTN